MIYQYHDGLMETYKAASPPTSNLVIFTVSFIYIQLHCRNATFAKKQIHSAFLKKYKKDKFTLQKANNLSKKKSKNNEFQNIDHSRKQYCIHKKCPFLLHLPHHVQLYLIIAGHIFSKSRYEMPSLRNSTKMNLG